MDLSLHCLLIIVLIYMLSCFMILLAFLLGNLIVVTKTSTSVLWNYNFYSVNCVPSIWKEIEIFTSKHTIDNLHTLYVEQIIKIYMKKIVI